MTELSKLDWVLIAITAASVIFSVIKGFTRELISLGALIWGFILACWFYSPLGERLLPWLRTREVANMIAFVLILGAAMLVGGIVAHFVRKLLEKSGLRWFDRLLGAGFGMVRGVLVCAILVLILAVFPLGPQPLNQSTLAPYVMQGARIIVNVAPREMQTRFHEGFERMRQAWYAKDDETHPAGKPSNKPGTRPR